MVTYVLIVSVLTWRLSAVVVEWNAAEYANTARVCIAVDRAKEMHNKGKKALIGLYHYKLLRFSFLFPYAGGIDPKKRGADPRTFPFHKYLRNCLVEDTIRIVNPSKAVTIGLLGLAMAARPLYTLGGTYLMLAVVVMVLLLDLGLLLLTRHVRRIFVALLPAKLPLSFVEQFEDTNGGISKREVDSARSGALARTYTMQLEDKAEDRLRKLHDTIGAVWTVNRAVKRFRKNASRISVAPVESQVEAVAEDQESDIRSAVSNSAVGSFRLEGGEGDCSGSDDESARGSVAVDLPGAIESNGKGNPNAMENRSGSLGNSGTKGIGKSRSVRMDVPEAAGEESTKSLVSSGEESQQSELLPPPFLLRGHFGMITGAATGTGWIPLLTSRLYLLITGTDAPNQQESMFWFWANGPTFIFGVLQLILLLDAVLLSLVIRILVLGLNGELFPDDDAETDHSAELALVDVFAGIVVILIFHQIWRMVPGFLYYFTPATATELMKRANIIEQTVEKEVVLNDWVDIFDVDGDGCLNLREFKNLVAVLEYLESSFDAPACHKWLARVFKLSDNGEEITPKIFQKGILERLGTPLRESEVAEFFRAVLRAEPSRADGNGEETKLALLGNEMGWLPSGVFIGFVMVD
ncbi:hypothetical protein FOZ60_002995 [Perkinsus olseni]|uniref:EF-hand domain-containing protein n=1 Tax=Perkinsus olseni TaxID=32597 RepID=A0A7J6NYS0_PEROL|nr:hypothetical protein FOZ60_002995 [Perkinsus olseni]